MGFVSPSELVVVWIIMVVLIFLFPLFALVSILKNRFRDNDKLIWVLIVLLLPIIGSILYFTIGRSKRIK